MKAIIRVDETDDIKRKISKVADDMGETLDVINAAGSDGAPVTLITPCGRVDCEPDDDFVEAMSQIRCKIPPIKKDGDEQ